MTRKPRDIAREWVGMGKAMLARMELHKAESSFRKAVDTDPNFAEAWKCLGDCLLQKTQYDEADEAYQKAMKLDSSYKDESLEKRAELVRIRNEAKAMDHIREGVTKLSQGRMHNAISMFERATSLHTENASAWKLFGDALFLGGSLRDARNAHRKARSLDPSLMDEFIQILEAEDSRNLIPHDYTIILLIVLSRDPPEVTKKREELRESHGDALEQRAVELTDELEKRPKSNEKWILLGDIYDLMDRHGEAAEAYGKAVELDLSDIKSQTKLVRSVYRQAQSIYLAGGSEVKIDPFNEMQRVSRDEIWLYALAAALLRSLDDKPPDYYI
ncbi:MAG: tetratricopeptide repeat protein [Candidatus Thorarchaeota archaeon]